MRTRAASNLPKVGHYNRGVVLEAVRRASVTEKSGKGISRAEIAQRTGLTAQAVSGIVRRLLADGIITESGVESSGMGKPRRLLRVRPDAGYAVGMHFDPGEISCAIVDFAGRPMNRIHRPVPQELTPRDAVSLMAATMRPALDRSDVDGSRLHGVGLAVPGPIDSVRGRVIAPPQLPSWRDVPLARMLQEETGASTVLANDATAAVIGEQWAGAAQSSTDVGYFYFGTGIGGGLVLRNDIYDGPSHNAAEFGHIAVDPSGPECYCGNRGCVEALCRPATLVARARARGATGEPTRLGDEFDYEQLCLAARSGDALALDVLTTAARDIGTAAVTLVNILDLELIVLGGRGLRHVTEIFRDEVARALATRPLARGTHTARVAVSTLGEDAAAVGAATIIFHSAFSARTSILWTGQV